MPCSILYPLDEIALLKSQPTHRPFVWKMSKTTRTPAHVHILNIKYNQGIILVGWQPTVCMLEGDTRGMRRGEPMVQDTVGECIFHSGQSHVLIIAWLGPTETHASWRSTHWSFARPLSGRTRRCGRCDYLLRKYERNSSTITAVNKVHVFQTKSTEIKREFASSKKQTNWAMSVIPLFWILNSITNKCAVLFIAGWYNRKENIEMFIVIHTFLFVLLRIRKECMCGIKTNMIALFMRCVRFKKDPDIGDEQRVYIKLLFYVCNSSKSLHVYILTCIEGCKK